LTRAKQKKKAVTWDYSVPMRFSTEIWEKVMQEAQDNGCTAQAVIRGVLQKRYRLTGKPLKVADAEVIG
jgi:predicted DNA binding CopG/RHH family protein